jgi:hypothetical protein
MAMRLACPSCGAAFSPKPADAGKIVPCARCGVDLEMPASVPAKPQTAKPATRKRRDSEDEPDERPTRRKREAVAAGGSLLWLWVLLGTGALGLAVGAGVYFLVREKPDDPTPIAEKPAEKPAPVVPPMQPPEGDTPKPPKDNRPPIAPPKPNDPIVPVVPGAPGVAQTIPGLKFYLPCDALADGKVIEAVSGKPVGRGAPVLVDSPRGKAVRLTHDRANPNRHALDLSDQRDALVVPAGRPFTLTFWARRVESDAQGGFGAYLFDASNAPNNRHSRSLYCQLLPNAPATAALTLIDAPNRGEFGNITSARPMNTVNDPEAWTHFAVVRNEKGEVRWLVNGADAPDARPIPFSAELRYETLGLLRSSSGKTVADIDDFCLYDRVLTEAEFGLLTGLKIAPRPNNDPVAGKMPAPGAVPGPADIKGLRFHLPCDAIQGGALTETVSGKPVGVGRKLELVDGPRGKAVRIRAGGLGAEREGFNLNDHVGALSVGEGKPFTMALWVRTDNWDNIGGTFVYGHGTAPGLFQSFSMYRYTKGVGFLVNQGKPGGAASPLDQLARGTHEMQPTKGWIHLALTRDEKGTVRMAVDGKPAIVAQGAFSAELKFTRFTIGWQQGQEFVADYDEFCLYDRVLTDEEIGWLAGGKPAPKDVVIVPPKPPVVFPPVFPPKDPPVVIPPKMFPDDPRRIVQLAPPPREVVRVVKPKDPVDVVPMKVVAPAGVDPKGLKLYLPFDELNEGEVREGVTGKFLGSCAGVDLVAGPRGKAARIAIDRADGGQGTCKLDFAAVAERVDVPAGKPFALALWFREEARDPMSKGGSTVLRMSARPNREYDRALQIGLGTNGVVHFSARATPDRLDPKRETAVQWAGVANAAKWQHLAVVRDEKNVVRVYLNGKHVPTPGKPDPVWDGPLGYDRFLFGDPDALRTVLEVDEFCLFERVLTAEELKKLAEPAK